MYSRDDRRRELLAALPAVGILLQHPRIEALCGSLPRSYVHNTARRIVDDLRREVLEGVITDDAVLNDLDAVAERIAAAAQRGLANRLQRAVNAAGVILHTGLGRAPLAPSAQDALREAAERYCILATEQESGKRGDRQRHNEELLRELTGAEAALVVNNNASAVMLALNTFCQGRESVISRGELVEIGGMFRIPDVMRRSGTEMVEVGTTNKTHLRDYAAALTDQTAALVKVHTSNYRIEGFHQEVPVRDLAGLAAERSLMVLYDIGSGAMVDLRKWGLEYEPTVPEGIAEGADVVTFSGDKLLGGPQCGVLVGRRDCIETMSRNPLMRAIRPDKLILAALNGTLRLFLDPDSLPETHPIYRMMTEPPAAVKRRARRLAGRLKGPAAGLREVETAECATEMGSGSLPARGIPSWGVLLKPLKMDAETLARRLRLAEPPVFSRIEDERVVLDCRTVTDTETVMVARALEQVAQGLA